MNITTESMNIELLRQDNESMRSDSMTEFPSHVMNTGNYLPSVRLRSRLYETRVNYGREVDSDHMNDLDIFCINDYLKHGRRTWRALFATLGVTPGARTMLLRILLIRPTIANTTSSLRPLFYYYY